MFAVQNKARIAHHFNCDGSFDGSLPIADDVKLSVWIRRWNFCQRKMFSRRIFLRWKISGRICSLREKKSSSFCTRTHTSREKEWFDSSPEIFIVKDGDVLFCRVTKISFRLKIILNFLISTKSFANYPQLLCWHWNVSLCSNLTFSFPSFFGGKRKFPRRRCDCAGWKFKDHRKIFGVFIHEFSTARKSFLFLAVSQSSADVSYDDPRRLENYAPKVENATHSGKVKFGIRRKFPREFFFEMRAAASSIFLFRILRSGSFFSIKCFAIISSDDSKILPFVSDKLSWIFDYGKVSESLKIFSLNSQNFPRQVKIEERPQRPHVCASTSLFHSFSFSHDSFLEWISSRVFINEKKRKCFVQGSMFLCVCLLINKNCATYCRERN